MTNKSDDLKVELASISPIHFIGAAGSGMRPLAEFVAGLGIQVSGSDSKADGIGASFPLHIEGTPEDQERQLLAKTIVYSSAIGPSHPAFMAAKNSDKRTLHRSELLAIICRFYQTISVAGTHGKSTTSAMVAHVLKQIGDEPSWIIGAPFASGEDSVRIGSGPWLVIEADESDGSFLRYETHVSVVTNIDADHMDYYQTVDRLNEAFKKYLGQTSTRGGIVFSADHGSTAVAAANYRGFKISYGLSNDADLRAENYLVSGLSARSSISFKEERAELTLPLPGKHNTSNALAAIGVGLTIGHSLSMLATALGNFPGVQRRLQRYPCSSNAIIFDDYAHNPQKIQSCIRGLEEAFPGRRIIACFQPHRFSRISSLYGEFIASFKGRDIVVVVLPVYASGEAPIKGFEASRIASDIARVSGAETFSESTFKGCAELITSMLDPKNDVVVTIGAGDIWKVARLLSLDL